MATSIQDLDMRFPIVNDDGTPTDYFLRLFNDRGTTADETTESVEGKVDASRQVNTGTGLAGGGDLSEDRTLTLDAELGDLSNVDMATTPPTDGQAPIWDDTNKLWIPGDAGGGGGGSGRDMFLCRATLSAPIVGGDYSSITTVPFDTEDFDEAGAHNGSGVITIPAGVRYVAVTGMVRGSGHTADEFATAQIALNGSVIAFSRIENGSTDVGIPVQTGVISVSSGDTIELRYIVESDTVSNISDLSFLAVHQVPDSTGSGSGALEFIEEVVATGGESSLDFSGIPQDYVSLHLEFAVADATFTEWRMRANGNSSAIYNTYRQFGGNSTGGDQQLNQTSWTRIAFGNGVANLFNSGRISLYEYTATDKWKMFESHASQTSGSTNDAGFVIDQAGTMRTTAAITSLSFISVNGNIRAGSVIRLYGKKKVPSSGPEEYVGRFTGTGSFIAVPLDASDGEIYRVKVSGKLDLSQAVYTNLSIDNGATWLTGASDYKYVDNGGSSSSSSLMRHIVQSGAGREFSLEFVLDNMNNKGAQEPTISGHQWSVNSGGAPSASAFGGGLNGLTANDYNAFRIVGSGGASIANVTVDVWKMV